MPIIDNYRRYRSPDHRLHRVERVDDPAMVPLPWIIQAPRLFAGQDRLGRRRTNGAAFGTIQDSLSFFRNHYNQFAAFRASIIRLHGLVDANARGRELPEVTVEPSEAADPLKSPPSRCARRAASN